MKAALHWKLVPGLCTLLFYIKKYFNLIGRGVRLTKLYVTNPLVELLHVAVMKHRTELTSHVQERKVTMNIQIATKV